MGSPYSPFNLEADEEEALSYDQRMMVKQYVAIVTNSRGVKFRVFKTGNDKYYLFDQLWPGTDCSTGVQFPVERSRLRDDLRRALTHGVGNNLPLPPFDIVKLATGKRARIRLEKPPRRHKAARGFLGIRRSNEK